MQNMFFHIFWKLSTEIQKYRKKSSQIFVDHEWDMFVKNIDGWTVTAAALSIWGEGGGEVGGGGGGSRCRPAWLCKLFGIIRAWLLTSTSEPQPAPSNLPIQSNYTYCLRWTTYNTRLLYHGTGNGRWLSLCFIHHEYLNDSFNAIQHNC